MNLKEAIHDATQRNTQYESRRSTEWGLQKSFFREVDQATGQVLRQEADPRVIQAVQWVTKWATEDSVLAVLR